MALHVESPSESRHHNKCAALHVSLERRVYRVFWKRAAGPEFATLRLQFTEAIPLEGRIRNKFHYPTFSCLKNVCVEHITEHTAPKSVGGYDSNMGHGMIDCGCGEAGS